jgi:hypothetical protein
MPTRPTLDKSGHESIPRPEPSAPVDMKTFTVFKETETEKDEFRTKTDPEREN